MNIENNLSSHLKIARTLSLSSAPFIHKNYIRALRELTNKKAFTLVETLITLVIIGVIAAMTIPTLISKYHEQETVTKLKKAQSILANAISMQKAKGDEFESHTSYGFSADTLTNNLKGLNCYTSPNLDICSEFGSRSIVPDGGMLLDDGIAVGNHNLGNEHICVAFEKKSSYKTYFDDNPYSYCFWVSDDYTLIPFGAESNVKLQDNSIAPSLTQEETCPHEPVGNNFSGCTYWTLRTGKVTKKAGEWFDD